MTESERAMEEAPEPGRPSEAGRLVAPARPAGPRLKEAMREARIDLAERTGVIVDLRNAEIARLELLNEALDPLFAEIPPEIELFDRGIAPGEPPRLWIDMIAHVAMGRDKRIYRFLQDTRYGRRVLAESGEVPDMVAAVTKYVARRLVERERLLEGDSALIAQDELLRIARRRRRRWRLFLAFITGLVIGSATLFTIAWFAARHLGR
jgi:hypothetical protein